MDFRNPYPSARSVVMGTAAVATSHPLASSAGIRMLERGGNAVDAVLAAAMVLTVVEPTGCGIGSDAFAIIHDGHSLHGLNSSGRSPAAWSSGLFEARETMPQRGWGSVTVPGAVAAWITLSERFGRLPLEDVAAPAIQYAERGYAVSPIIANLWKAGAQRLAEQPGFAECFMPFGRPPSAGEIFRSPAHAETLSDIVNTKGESFYKGRLAGLMVDHAKANGSLLSLEDLATHSADWVDVLSTSFSGMNVHELPPNGQGIATLMALGILDEGAYPLTSPDDPLDWHLCIEATKLALADTEQYVSDPAFMSIDPQALLDR